MDIYFALAVFCIVVFSFTLGVSIGKSQSNKKCQEDLDNLRDMLFEEEGRSYD